MAIVIETTQINAKFLGGWALNKIMLGIIEIFPNIATTPEPNPSDMFVNGEQGAWYDFYDSMDTKIAFRRNLLLWSESFTTTPMWALRNSVVTPNAILAPDGTMTAARMSEQDITEIFAVFQTVTSNTNNACSVYFKAGERTHGYIVTLGRNPTNGALASNTFFDLTTGVVSGDTTGTMTDVGGGWWRCVAHTNLVPGSLEREIRIGIGDGTVQQVYPGDSTKGLYIWGAQMDATSTATAYQKVTNWDAEFLARFPSHALFQESVGRTPITNVEQPLGLASDKRLAGALGPNIMINGDFSSSAGWSLEQGVTISGGTLNFTDSNGTSAFRLSTGETGKLYEAEFDLISISQGGMRIALGNNFSPTYTVPGHYKIRMVAGSTAQRLWSIGLTTAVCDNFTMREVLGNHAIQATAANRPVLSARKNSLQQTENISNDYWLLGGGGTVSGDSFRPTVMAGWMQSTLGVTVPIGTAYSISLDFMPDGLNAFSAYLGSFGNDRVGVNVDVTNLTMSDLIQGVALPPTNKLITDIGGGWHRLSFTALSQAAAEVLTIRSLGPNDNSNGVNGVRLTKLQLEFGPTATRYQRVNTATDYDTMGFPFSIRWNGVNNNLRTPGPVDFSGSDQLTCFFGAQRYRSAQWEEMVTVADGGQPWNESTNVFQTHVLPNSGMSCGLTTDNLGGRARSVTLFPAIPERTPFITSIGFDVGVTGNGQMPVGRLTIDGALSVAGNPAGTDQNPPMLNQRINLAGVFAGGSGHLLGETSQVVLIGRTPATQEIADTEAFIAKMMEGAIP